ncbi:MAG: hypothetical protein IPK32_22105 [Verrucomicrobiaceae bacterium]|nr:hypothetical protein [Verrucomicrobiaceae bacterium]
MNDPSDKEAELQRRLNPPVWREGFFWVGMLWAGIVLLQALTRSTSQHSYLAVFTSCMFFISAHEQLAKKRMKAMLDWIEFKKTQDKPQC